MPELSVDDLAVAVHRGAYNACVDLATQVGAGLAHSTPAASHLALVVTSVSSNQRHAR